MNKLVKHEGGLSSLITGNDDFLLEIPESKEIFLFDTVIVGCRYVGNISEVFPTLASGERLLLLREPDNEYDERAVVVLRRDRQKLGYIARYENRPVTNLLDAGKEIYAVIKSLDGSPDEPRISIEIFMHE